MTLAPDRPASLVGARVRRINDPRLLRGEGRYVDDVHLAGMVHATVLRSPVAHGDITSFDATDAGALLVLGPDDVAAATRPLDCVWLAEGQRQTTVPVAERRVRYVGQPIGVVVAASRPAAEDAAELVEVDYDELPTVSDQEAAIAAGAPLLHPDWGTNVAAEFVVGDDRATVDAAMAQAARVIERRLVIPRIVPSPMETRGVVAGWDANLRELTVWTSTQTPHHVRDHLALSLGLSADQVRVIAPDLGGGFGSKEHLYPDEVLVALAAMRLGRPVKWIEDRVEHFTATMHARDAIHYARLASGRRRPVRRDRQRHHRQPRGPPVERGHGSLPHLRHDAAGALPLRLGRRHHPGCPDQHHAHRRLPRLRHAGGGVGPGASGRRGCARARRRPGGAAVDEHAARGRVAPHDSDLPGVRLRRLRRGTARRP